jgi:transposase InsO family protein
VRSLAARADEETPGTIPSWSRSSAPSKSDLALDDLDQTLERRLAWVVDYIDPFYNPERRHSTLDYFSPIEYEFKQIVLQ